MRIPIPNPIPIPIFVFFLFSLDGRWQLKKQNLGDALTAAFMAGAHFVVSIPITIPISADTNNDTNIDIYQFRYIGALTYTDFYPCMCRYQFRY